MPGQTSFDYAVVRVVPRVEREEFMNVGVIVFCRTTQFLEARVCLDVDRLVALSPNTEKNVGSIQAYLDLIPRICAGGLDAGPIGALDRSERFHWLSAPRSTVIQTSPIHSGLCDDPKTTLEELFCRLVQ